MLSMEGGYALDNLSASQFTPLPPSQPSPHIMVDPSGTADTLEGGYALELGNISTSHVTPLPPSLPSLSIVVDPPAEAAAMDDIVDTVRTTSPEELLFEETAGDVPEICKPTLIEAYGSYGDQYFYATSPEEIGNERYDERARMYVSFTIHTGLFDQHLSIDNGSTLTILSTPLRSRSLG
jgi:hypothetical protein